VWRWPKIAEKKGVLLNFEAAVAGGIPVIKTMRESMAGNSVTRVYGIMNGTCNYILTRMEAEGISFDDCLKDAQRLGYAEADPTFDIEGNDTAHKLSILTSLAFGTRIAANDIYLEGISNITQADIRAAADLGYRIKLLGCCPAHRERHRAARASDHGADRIGHRAGAWRHQCGGDRNRHSGRAAAVGPGAGGNATASAVIGDIADIAKSRPGFQHGPVFGHGRRRS
jgi:homoserine dehydrogenase